MIKIFISTCDSHDIMLKPFMFLFNKFWGKDQEVTILGYEKPKFNLEDNFNFVSMGKSRKTSTEWSTGLREYFETIEDEHFIWALEDLFILKPVRFDILNKLFQHAQKKKIGRTSLTCGVQFKDHDILETFNDFNIIEQRRDTSYRISVIWSIWNREYLLRYLDPEISPWQMEVDGSEKAKNDGYRVIGTSENHAIDFAGACQPRHGGTPTGPLDFRVIDKPHLSLDNDIIQEMINNKIITPDGRVFL